MTSKAPGGGQGRGRAAPVRAIGGRERAISTRLPAKMGTSVSADAFYYDNSSSDTNKLLF